MIDKIWKIVFQIAPEWLEDSLSICFHHGIFPKEEWKLARLILIRKPKKEDSPSAYKPICLLNKLDKICERIIADRLTDHIESVEGLSQNQFGFKPSKSTCEAVLAAREFADQYTDRGDIYIAISLDMKIG